jgi:hypothetical protein
MAVSLSALLNDVSSRDAVLQSLSESQETLSEKGYSGNLHVSPGNTFSLSYMLFGSNTVIYANKTISK